MGIKLKPHNEIAYGKVKETIEEKGKAAVIHPTGTGKTYIALKMLESTTGKAIFVAPTNHILNQTKEVIEEAWTNGDITEEQYKRLGNIEFTTYTSLMEKSKIDSGYDQIILDEFHRVGAPEWGKGVQRLLESSPNAQILGLSATPMRAVDNRDMAEELFKDAIASEMTLEETVAEGILPVPTYINGIYSLKEVVYNAEAKIREIPNDEKRKELEKRIEDAKRQLENAESIEDIFGKHIKKNGKYIIFCEDIDDMHKKMKKAEEMFSKVGEVNLYEISYKKNEELNEDTLKRFKEGTEKLDLLFSVNKLNEGVHVNGIDGVIMMRKTKSPIIYMQQLGRALSAGNEGTPQIFDLVNNIDSSEYIYHFMERVQKIAKERNLDTKHLEAFKILEEQREIKKILEDIKNKLDRGNTIDEFIEKLEKLQKIGVDVSKLGTKDTIKDLAKKSGITEEQIKEIGLDPNDNIGASKDNIARAYRGKGRITPPTEVQVQKLLELGISLEERNVIDEFIEKLEKLQGIGVDVSKLRTTDSIKDLAKKSGITEEQIVKIGLNPEDKIGISKRRIAQAYRGKGNYTPPTKEQVQKLLELGISLEERNVIDEFIEKLEKLQKIGVDVSKLEIKDSIKDLAKKSGITEEQIVKIGLNPEDKIGKSKSYIAQAYRGTGKRKPPTEVQVQKLLELGISLEKIERNVIDEFIEKLEKLQKIGVDVSKLGTTDSIKDLAKKSGITEEQIVKIGLKPEDKIGSSKNHIARAYRGKVNYMTLTEEQVQKLLEFGISLEERNVTDEFIEKLEKLQGIGVDVSKLRTTDSIKDLAKKSGITEEQIVKIGLNPEDKIGTSKNSIAMAYRGKGKYTPPTKEQVQKLLELGIRLEMKRKRKGQDIGKASYDVPVEKSDEADAVLKELIANKEKEGGIDKND